jgi:hypothetical protein
MNHISLTGKLSDNNNEVLRIAINLGIIQPRDKLKRVGIKKQIGKLFVFNRIYSPVFGLSYRIRGNSVEEFSDDDLNTLFDLSKQIKPKRFLSSSQINARIKERISKTN